MSSAGSPETPNAAGAIGSALEGGERTLSREEAERQAARQRRDSRPATTGRCAPDLPDLAPELLYTGRRERPRYAIFLLDRDGIIRCWGEGARLMKWWTKQQAEGAHLRLLYPDGGAEDGTAEAHLDNAAENGRVQRRGTPRPQRRLDLWADAR